jgi:hypothetical protein
MNGCKTRFCSRVAVVLIGSGGKRTTEDSWLNAVDDDLQSGPSE